MVFHFPRGVQRVGVDHDQAGTDGAEYGDRVLQDIGKLHCLANMAHLAEKVVPKTTVKHVIVTEVADLLPPLKRLLINSVIKYVTIRTTHRR